MTLQRKLTGSSEYVHTKKRETEFMKVSYYYIDKGDNV